MAIDQSASLADLVIEDPRRTRILESFGLDYCCHGAASLSDAAEHAGVDLDTVSTALELPPVAAADSPRSPGDNASLAHDIVDTHHAYMWEEMPRLQALVNKVHTVHGQRHPELADVKATFDKAVAALDPHMTTEERRIFPLISRIEKGQAAGDVGSLPDSIATLRSEHEAVGELFATLRTLTGGYTVPADGCASYQAMMVGLEAMELDLHEHIHKENNVLFPQALALVAEPASR